MKKKMTVLKLKKIVDNMNAQDMMVNQMNRFEVAKRAGYIKNHVCELTEEYVNKVAESSNIDDVKENMDNFINTAFKTIIAMSPKKWHPFIRNYYTVVIQRHDSVFDWYDHTGKVTRGEYLNNIIIHSVMDCIESVAILTMTDKEVYEYECK